VGIVHGDKEREWVAGRKPTAYNAGNSSPARRMPGITTAFRNRRGLTVLALVLLVIVLVAAVVLISRYIAV
jgi:hypothetical protein